MITFSFTVHRIVDKLASLLLPKKGQLMNKKRFDEEFLEEKDEDGKPLPPKKNNKPEDYDAIFTGNIDDSFRIGVSVSKRTLRVRQVLLSFFSTGNNPIQIALYRILHVRHLDSLAIRYSNSS